MADSYSVKAILSAIDNLSPVLNQAANNVSSFGQNVQNKLGGVGKAMTVAGAATTAMGMTGLKSFGQFQQSLNTAAVVAGGTAKDISGLSDVANKMGADLPLSAQQASDAMVEMARNGASVGQIKQQFPAIAQAATAAGSDLQATAGVVQQAMNIWGNSLKSPQQAAEILVQTANMSNASIEDMQQAMATIGGTAKLAGMSLQDTSEAIGLLTNKGFSAAQASDDLNHAILQMMAPSAVAQKTMKQLGLSFTDAQGKMKPFPTILNEVANAMQGLSKSEQTAALKAMFGTAGMQAIAPLLDTVKNKTNDSANSWDAWSKKVDQAAGSSAKANASLKSQANEMQKNVGAQIEQLGGNWEALRNTAMASSNGVSTSILKIMNSTLEWANSSHSGIAKVARGFIGLSPVIGPAITAVGGFITNAGKIAHVAVVAGKGLLGMGKFAGGLVGKLLGIGSGGAKAGAGMEKTAQSSSKASSPISNAGKASSMSAGQILALGAAVMMAAGGAALLVGSFALLVNSVTKLAAVGPIGAATFLAVAAGMAAVIAVAGVAGKMIGEFGIQAGVAYAGMALLIVSFAALTVAVALLASTGTAGVVALAALTVAIIAIVAALTLAAPILTANTVGLIAFTAAVLAIGVAVAVASVGLALLVVAFTGLVTAITGLASQGPIAIGVIVALTAGIAAMVVVLAIFGPLLTASAVGLLAFGAAILMAGVGIGVAAAGIAMLVDALSNLLSTNTVLGQIISDVWNGIKTVISSVAQALGPIVSAGFNAMKSVATGIMNAFKGVISGVWNGIKGVFNAGVNFIKSVTHFDLAANGRAIMNSFFNGLKSVWESIKSFVSGIAGWIKAHKGPISLDRKLLIPAGQAIMSGLNEGLTNGFENVQSNVSTMADAISNAATVSIPPIQNTAFNRSISAIQDKMSDMSANVGGTMTANVNGNVSQTLWQDRMEGLMNTAIDRLDNVDQHPVVTYTTAQRMHEDMSKFDTIQYNNFKGGR